MAVRPIDANAMLNELRPVNFEAEHSAVLLSDASKMMREWVERQPTLTPPNEPMTLEQLREMDGEPVYLIVDDGYEPLEMWALIDVPEKDHIVLINNIGGRSAYYSDDDLERDHITAYRRPPEGEA